MRRWPEFEPSPVPNARARKAFEDNPGINQAQALMRSALSMAKSVKAPRL